MILRSVVAFFRGGTAGFLPLEEEILKEAALKTGWLHGSRLRERVARINLVQRHDGGRQVHCFELARGKPVFAEELRLTATDGRIELATFKFRSLHGRPYAGAVWLEDGQLASMEFDNPTEDILDEQPLGLRMYV